MLTGVSASRSFPPKRELWSVSMRQDIPMRFLPFMIFNKNETWPAAPTRTRDEDEQVRQESKTADLARDPSKSLKKFFLKTLLAPDIASRTQRITVENGTQQWLQLEYLLRTFRKHPDAFLGYALPGIRFPQGKELRTLPKPMHEESVVYKNPREYILPVPSPFFPFFQ